MTSSKPLRAAFRPDPAVARLLAEAGIIKTGPVLTYTSDVYLTHWKRLQDWIEGERKVLLTRQQIRTLAKEWRESGRKQEYLLSGAKMQWAVMFFEQPSPVEKQFVEASQRRAKWRRIIPIAVAASAILGGLLGFNYYSQSNRASRILAAATAVNDPLVSVLLTRDLYSSHPPSSGLSALQQISKTRIPRVVLLGSKGPVYSACFSPDGKTVISAGDDDLCVGGTPNRAVRLDPRNSQWTAAPPRLSIARAVDRGESRVETGRLYITEASRPPLMSIHPCIFAYRPDGDWLARASVRSSCLSPDWLAARLLAASVPVPRFALSGFESGRPFPGRRNLRWSDAVGCGPWKRGFID